jgi:O-antigen/teichoic acid export membrane protein
MMTLLRHSAVYLLARGLPGLINFLSIAIYTRLLSPDEYGRYALVVAAATLANLLLFDWIKLSLLRFLPGKSYDQRLLMSTSLVLYVAMSFLVLLLTIPFIFVFSMQDWHYFVVLGVPLILSQSWFEMNLQVLRSSFKPFQYGIALGIRSVVALAVGVALVKSTSWGAFAPLCGLLAGNVAASLYHFKQEWSGVAVNLHRDIARQLFTYGYPLIVTQSLSFALGFADRFMIAGLIGQSAAGLYAATYDFVQQISVFLLSTISLAVYPLLVRSYEQGDLRLFRDQAKLNILLLLALASPIVVFLVLSPSQVALFYFGNDYKNEARKLVPYLAIGMLLSALRSQHFDVAFQLGKNTLLQTMITAVAVVFNILLNLILLPRYGTPGAAWATLLSFLLATLLSALVGASRVPLPIPWLDIAKIVFASAIMGGAVLTCSLGHESPEIQIVVKAITGFVLYCIVLWILDMARLRSNATSYWTKRKYQLIT